ncbi:MAG TPA: DUF2238 domain-containing protein [Acidimicrobiales bacterium]|jgi:uncharacterized membrane protein YjdF|nr:DUF2238 domain-containing protein [Acidimicrobiales bacterium]
MPSTATLVHAPLSPIERRALRAVVAAAAGFAVYGMATGAPSTLAYLFTVAALGALVLGLRRRPLPAPLVIGMAVLAVAHLAGGLVRVGDGVLYNATFGSPILRYDHLFHTAAVFVGTLVLWTVLVRRAVPGGGAGLVVLCVLAGLGLGALNEMVEFLSTLAHSGSHVGGYANTGWDLVCNTGGGLAAGAFLRRSR